MNYALRMLAVIGWIWAVIFGVFLLWKLNWKGTADKRR